MADPAHEVYVLCNCGNVLECRMERYVADVRIAYQEIERLKQEAAADGRR